ncbi:MAG: ABC transporter permease [Chloroflexi bacterium]|nr:ABC transporter permease [Chloroflexota bacterium]
MRAIIVFRKTLREMSRDGWLLGLTLAFAPFFVLLYYLITAGGSTTYTILTINNDAGIQLADGTTLHAGREAVAALTSVTYADGQPLLKTRAVADLAEAEPLLRDRVAAAYIVIPEDFSRTLAALQSGDRSVTTKIVFGGDVANPYYMVGANLSLIAIDDYIMRATGQQPLIGYKEEPLGTSLARTEYETYVPGTLIFAVIMLIFLASMTVARELETGTLRRLQLTPMKSLDYLGGVTAALVLIGTASFALAFGCAVAVGFRSEGSAWAGILIGAVTCLSVIGVGMVVASFTRTVSQAFIVANFPMAMMMFFSGVIYPLPKIVLFTLGGREIGLYDILPPTHAVVALNKIFNLGADLSQVTFELSALVILSALYFFVGVWMFQRFHLR